MKALGILFSRSIPAYFWLGIGYAIYVIVIASTTGGDSSETDINAGLPLYERVEASLTGEIFAIPLFSGNSFDVTWTILFTTFGFVCAWIEVVRATQIRMTGRNDTWSLIVTLLAFVLFVGVESFGTSAFLIVALVGFGDVLLDRIVGQAVARRDFGGVFGAGGE